MVEAVNEVEHHPSHVQHRQTNVFYAISNNIVTNGNIYRLDVKSTTPIWLLKKNEILLHHFSPPLPPLPHLLSIGNGNKVLVLLYIAVSTDCHITVMKRTTTVE